MPTFPRPDTQTHTHTPVHTQCMHVHPCTHMHVCVQGSSKGVTLPQGQHDSLKEGSPKWPWFQGSIHGNQAKSLLGPASQLLGTASSLPCQVRSRWHLLPQAVWAQEQSLSPPYRETRWKSYPVSHEMRKASVTWG